MKKVKRILAAALSIIIVMGTFAGCSEESEKDNKTENKTNNEAKVDTGNGQQDVQEGEQQPVGGKIEEPEAEDIPYEKLYVEYLEKNIRDADPDEGDFAKGMFLCDLNEDEIPELFSLDWEEHAVRFHQLKNGEVIEPKDKNQVFYIDGYSVAFECSYFVNPRDFRGVYRNKKTGNLALISSVMATDNQSRFDMVTYDGDKLSVRNLAKEGKSRSGVMKEYEFVEGAVYGSYLARGTYQIYQLDSAKYTLEEHINEFKNAKKPSYEKAQDGEKDYYLHDVQLSKGEIVIAPVAEITLEQYKKATSSENDNLIEINGETYGVKFDEAAYENNGSVILYDMAGNEMYFYEPTDEYPVSKIHGLSGEPVVAKITDNTKLITAASSEEKEMGVDEFFNNFGSEYNGSYFTVTIKNNEVTEIYLTYRP